MNARIQNVRFGQAPPLRHSIVQASLVDQLHHQIKLAVIGARGENLDDMRIVHGRGGARFLFEAADLGWIGAQFRPENLERDEAIQTSVPRLVN